MSLSENPETVANRPWLATLLSSARITPNKSPEDVRRLRFAILEAGFDGRVGQCLNVRAPGQFGQRFHERLYSIADVETLPIRLSPTPTTYSVSPFAGI